ncbi:hypothetical protein D3C73_1494070 [compost metagenome]
MAPAPAPAAPASGFGKPQRSAGWPIRVKTSRSGPRICEAIVSAWFLYKKSFMMTYWNTPIRIRSTASIKRDLESN